MNTEYLEQEFKKRFSDTDKRIVIARSGLLCPLMGFYNIPGARVMTCMLSMSSYTAMRKFKTDIARIQNLSDNVCIINSIHDKPHSTDTSWANNSLSVLFNSSPLLRCGVDALIYSDIEPSDKVASRSSVMAALSRLCDLDLSIDDAAVMCGGAHDSLTPYRLNFAHKPGYGTAMINGKCTSFPLPLQDYKLVLVRGIECDEKKRHPVILKGLYEMREAFPHIINIESLSYKDFERIKHFIKNKHAVNYIHHIITENERIDSAVKALRSFDYSRFFELINVSQKSAERLWSIPPQIHSASDMIMELDGVMCSHFEKDGLYFIVRGEFIDNSVNTIRNYYKEKAGHMPTFYINSIL